MTPSKPMPLGAMLTAVLAGAALTSFVVWRANMASLEHAVNAKRAAVKKLALSGGIPPTQDVMDYLTERQQALEQRYNGWLEAIAAPEAAEAAQADPQLYFQERVHDLQRSLEQLAAARQITAPTALGLPKELPPTDTVPRFLSQLQLAQQAVELVFAQDVGAVTSFKIEDPEPIPAEEGSDTFLLVLPVRIRFAGTLDQTMKVLGALDRVRPLIDVRSVKLAPAADTAQLDAELLLARYTVMAVTAKPVDSETQSSATKKSKRRTGKSRKRSEE